MRNYLFPLVVGFFLGVALVWIFKLVWLLLVGMAIVWAGFMVYRFLQKNP